MVISGIELYQYIVVFHGHYEGEYSPVVVNLAENTSLKELYRNSAHLLDPNLADVIDLFEFILHLPRTSLDLYSLDELMIDSSHDTVHRIMPVPDSLFREYASSLEGDVTGVFLSDQCDPPIEKLAKGLGAPLPLLKQSDLSAGMIKKIWEELIKREGVGKDKLVQDAGKHYYLKGSRLKALPVVFMARQYGRVDDVLQRIYAATDNDLDGIIYTEYAKLKIENNTLVELHHQGCREVNRDQYRAEEKRQYQLFRPNVVLTLPGVALSQKKIRGAVPQISPEELRVIRFLAVHRAIAKDALVIEGSQVMACDYIELNKLEIACQDKTKPKARSIDRILSNIGRNLDAKLTKFQKPMLYRNACLTVFSDFPIGLAIPPHQKAPLSCISAISYRPLTPLTLGLELECQKKWQMNLRQRCNVLFLDCIGEDVSNRYVKEMSNKLFDILKEFDRQNSPRFQVIKENAYSVQEIKAVINRYPEADILYLSAHGFSDSRSNVSGIMVGEEKWLADTKDFRVPRFVILSACHTSPRGTGTVNIADMFMRAGANAVLSTLIPVGAFSNMKFMARLFTYIVEAQKGSDQYTTLADMWAGITATNAIYEMMRASEGMAKWLNEKNQDGCPRVVDLQLNRVPGRLVGNNVYDSTAELIKEMLHEEGMDGKFDDVLTDRRYFPESYFYQMVGYPENIFLYSKYLNEAEESR